MSFEINPIPTFSPGWLLILLGATTMMGGMTGFGGTTLPCCYKSHVILMCISIFGTGVFCLYMFGQMTLPISVEDVKREVKILRTLSGHENVVQFYTAFEDDDVVYIVMEARRWTASGLQKCEHLHRLLWKEQL
ncbi:hypothetical protein M758_1G077100 [Ceratodon purpureus]|nr:hypothetical protein M758_1G077100 [Ceratodon purpureus]